MKKIIRLTESDLEKIVKRVIVEQNLEREFVTAIQKFLNAKKITGDSKAPLTIDGKTDLKLNSQTAQAISKYQSMIKALPADGVWGENTWNKMPPQDKKLLEKFLAENDSPLDSFLKWVGIM